MTTANPIQDRPVTFHSNPRHGQDRWVIEKVLPGKRGGYFVEAGAGALSNTQALEEHFGWTGIGVEPHPARFDEIKQTRRCILENCCLTDVETEVDLRFRLAASGQDRLAAVRWWSH